MTAKAFTRSAESAGIDVARSRSLLGDEAVRMTDDEVASVTRHADAMARAIIDAYLAKTPSTRAA